MNIKDTHDLNDFWVVGVSYKNTDAVVRGSFAVNNDQYERLLSTALSYGIKEAFIVSTCNRTEVYVISEGSKQITNWLCSECAGDADKFTTLSYQWNGTAALKHLFELAAGLDSQILGDLEVLGQIKNAVKFSKQHGRLGSFLERIMNTVSQAAKAIKTNTDLSKGTASVSFAAIQYIREHITDICNKKIILVGTGKIGRNTCKNIVDYLHTHNITLINRTEETAVQLANELKLSSAPIKALEQQVADADIILVSTNATTPVITKDMIEGMGAKLLIDLSIPHNIARDVNELENTILVDVDMLSKIKDETLNARNAAVPKATAIIDEHIAELMAWMNMRQHVPVIKEVTHKLKNIPIAAGLLPIDFISTKATAASDERLQKVVNKFALRMRHDFTPGCHYIQAINDYIA